MRLLGQYNLQLEASYFTELLAVVQQSIEAGDLAAGKLFDDNKLLALESIVQDFQALQLFNEADLAGSESLNRIVGTIAARYKALLAEIKTAEYSFSSLLELMDQGALLLDRLIVEARTAATVVGRVVNYANVNVWNFAAGYNGVSFGTLPQTDPSTGLTYPDLAPLGSFLIASSGTILDGITNGFRSIPGELRSLILQRPNTDGIEERRSGEGWIQLDTLLEQPRLLYSSPRVTQILPTIADQPDFQMPHMQFRGTLEPGAPPVSVRFLLTPRQGFLDIPAGTTLVVLTSFRLSTTKIQVFQTGLNQNLPSTHYTLDPDSRELTFLVPPVVDCRVSFTELFPSYQCSTNELVYGTTIMLDAERPYPDGARELLPLRIVDGYFPLLDEYGQSMGVDFQLSNLPHIEGLVVVDTQTSDNYGEQAALRIELQQPGYYNAVKLKPSASYQQVITRVEGSGLDNDDRALLFEGNLVFDREFTLRFATRLLRNIYVHFYQPNYSYKEYEVDPPDKATRDAKNLLQPILPKVIRRVIPANPVKYRGALYSFGVQDVEVSWYEVSKPSVVITTPLKVASPEVLYVEYEKLGDVTGYLETRSYDPAGVVIASTPTTSIVSSRSVHFLPVTGAAYTNVFLRFVLKGDPALLRNFMIQASNRVG